MDVEASEVHYAFKDRKFTFLCYLGVYCILQWTICFNCGLIVGVPKMTHGAQTPWYMGLQKSDAPPGWSNTDSIRKAKKQYSAI